MAEYYSIFGRMPNAIQYLLPLLCDIDARASVFALTTNLKSGPCFAEICSIPLYHMVESRPIVECGEFWMASKNASPKIISGWKYLFHSLKKEL